MMTGKTLPLVCAILGIMGTAWGATNGTTRQGVLMIDDMERARPRIETNQVLIPQTNALGSGILLIDDMENLPATNLIQNGSQPILKNLGAAEEADDSVEKNRLGGRTGVYQQAPSKAEASRGESYGMNGAGLRIEYCKKSKGGPRGDGGFCGYYSILHSQFDDYLDASEYKFVSFFVRGATGEENFKVGAADRKWHLLDDTYKVKEIGMYLPAGKITTKWQRAVIPMSEFPINWKNMHGISICFEGELYPKGEGSGTVYIDDLMFIKEKPDDSETSNPKVEDKSKGSRPPASKEKKKTNQKDGEKEGVKPSSKAA